MKAKWLSAHKVTLTDAAPQQLEEQMCHVTISPRRSAKEACFFYPIKTPRLFMHQCHRLVNEKICQAGLLLMTKRAINCWQWFIISCALNLLVWYVHGPTLFAKANLFVCTLSNLPTFNLPAACSILLPVGSYLDLPRVCKAWCLVKWETRVSLLLDNIPFYKTGCIHIDHI